MRREHSARARLRFWVHPESEKANRLASPWRRSLVKRGELFETQRRSDSAFMRSSHTANWDDKGGGRGGGGPESSKVVQHVGILAPIPFINKMRGKFANFSLWMQKSSRFAFSDSGCTQNRNLARALCSRLTRKNQLPPTFRE